MDNTYLPLNLHDSSIPLAQCMGLKLREPFGFFAGFDVAYACSELDDILDEVHDLDETPLEGSRDVFMYEEFPSLGFDNIILPNPLDHSHISCLYLQPCPSPEHCIDMPINNFLIYDANIDLGYEDNVFDVVGVKVDNFASLGYFRG